MGTKHVKGGHNWIKAVNLGRDLQMKKMLKYPEKELKKIERRIDYHLRKVLNMK